MKPGNRLILKHGANSCSFTKLKDKKMLVYAANLFLWKRFFY